MTVEHEKPTPSPADNDAFNYSPDQEWDYNPGLSILGPFEGDLDTSGESYMTFVHARADEDSLKPQREAYDSISALVGPYQIVDPLSHDDFPGFDRDEHQKMGLDLLLSMHKERKIPDILSSLNAQRPWLIFWTLSTLYQCTPSKEKGCPSDLPYGLNDALLTDLWNELKGFWHPEIGGFCAGPASDDRHIPHALLTFAGIAASLLLQALTNLNGQASVLATDISRVLERWRDGFEAFEERLKTPTGFLYYPPLGTTGRHHGTPPADLRAFYAVMACRKLLDLPLDPSEILRRHTILQRYQSPLDGGFLDLPRRVIEAAENSTGRTIYPIIGIGEGHAGLSFCGVACHTILSDMYQSQMVDDDTETASTEIQCSREDNDNQALPLALAERLTLNLEALQSPSEGGFRGRHQKLVDSCYSHWVGASLRMLRRDHPYPAAYDARSLCIYLLAACQNANNDFFNPQKGGGGFRDKPSARIDMYHTHNSLLGLALALDNLHPVDHEFLQGLRGVDPSLMLPYDVLDWRKTV